MLNQFYDDNSAIKVTKMPSNLVEVPKVNEKYEITTFYSQNNNSTAPYLKDLKTLNVHNNNIKDPINNLNPTFYS